MNQHLAIYGNRRLANPYPMEHHMQMFDTQIGWLLIFLFNDDGTTLLEAALIGLLVIVIGALALLAILEAASFQRNLG